MNPQFKAYDQSVILRLIQEDFKMICLQDRLDAVGFNGVDFPNITYEIFDLMGIPEEVQATGLENQYWQWAQASSGLVDAESYVGWVFDQLIASSQREGIGQVA